MSLCTFDKEFLRSNVGHEVLWFYVNNNGEFTKEDVEKRLAEKMNLTDEMRSYIGPTVGEWVQHLNRKRDEYVQKSKLVSWCTDATYDLSMD